LRRSVPRLQPSAILSPAAPPRAKPGLTGRGWRAILARLATGECSVTQLAEPFEMSLPAVSKHLRVLERAGLIARRREAQRRPCRLQAAPLKAVADWAERYRANWEPRLDRLETYLQELQAKETKNDRKRRSK
jgi:DNA-binding transcriptional ArsR family regulator